MTAITTLDQLNSARLAEIYAWPEGHSLRLNMLIGHDGRIVGGDGTSHSLASKTDRELLRLIRADADAVIVGAASVRAEGWFLPPRGMLVVLSASGMLPWSSCPDASRIVVCPTLPDLLQWLRANPGRHLCEGGLMTARVLGREIGYSQIALTSRLTVDESLAIVTEHPEQYSLEFTARAQLINPGSQEGFFLWRRAATLKK